MQQESEPDRGYQPQRDGDQNVRRGVAQRSPERLFPESPREVVEADVLGAPDAGELGQREGDRPQRGNGNQDDQAGRVGPGEARRLQETALPSGPSKKRIRSDAISSPTRAPSTGRKPPS
jgi:hypothetical protein